MNPNGRIPKTFFLDEQTAVEFFDYAGWEIEYDSAAFYAETPAALDAAMERARMREDIAWQRYQMRYEDSAYRFVLEPLGNLTGYTVWFPIGLSPLAVVGTVAVVFAAMLLVLRYQVRYSFAFAEWDR